MGNKASQQIISCFVCFALFAVTTTASGNAQSITDSRRTLRQNSSDSPCQTVLNRFTNKTNITMPERTIFRSSAPREELTLNIIGVAQQEANAGNAAREVELTFVSKSERYKYHEQAEVNFIVDGKKIAGGTAHTLGGVPGTMQVQEKMQLTLPVEKFLQIAQGKTVEMQMGATEITLNRSDIEALRGFAECAGLSRPKN